MTTTIGAQQPQTTPVAHITDTKGRTALLWSSIGLAVLTSVLQGLVSTIILIAEDQAMWTFRFRIARFEHWWWTLIGTLLSVSFGLIVVSFLAGNNNDSVGVLALSTATALVIVRYAIPSWRHRRFISNRWLAWTGPSRTAIPCQYRSACGNAAHWRKLNKLVKPKSVPPASDDWGIAIKPDSGMSEDPTANLNGLGEIKSDMIFGNNWAIGPCVYDDGFHGESNINSLSLQWGEQEGFRRRVSRAVNSMPQSLLKSRPLTIDLYNGEGLTLAMGILGQNKGLLPREIVFDWDDSWKASRGIRRENTRQSTTTNLENSSIWAPRPNKVMRSYYKKAMEDQFGTLPAQFVAAATEFAVILLDCSHRAINDWLNNKLEQQSLAVNIQMSRPANYLLSDIRATHQQLQTLYRAQYVSMVLSLNYYPSRGTSHSTPTETHPLHRPDLHCFALLYLAEGAVETVRGQNQRGHGAPQPQWWQQNWVKMRLRNEQASLQGNWQQSAAWLLGLAQWPSGLDDWPNWPNIVYDPSIG
ncbi:MAG: hypothetical protein M1822_004831 [Bathelium mastoideum]|nr:MAG: hypothetical protein M1822_004831 [Bathelium mastoideum]